MVLFKFLLSAVLLLSTTFPFERAHSARKSLRLEAENRTAMNWILDRSSGVNSAKAFLKAFGQNMKPADKKFFLEATKKGPFPQIKKTGQSLSFGPNVKLKFVNVNLNKIEVNGIPFTLDPTAPLKIQTEALVRKLKLKNQNAIFNLMVPQAEAWIFAIAPVAAALWSATIAITRTVLVPVAISATSVFMSTGKGPLEFIMCLMPNSCEDKNGNLVAADIIERPEGGVVAYKRQKCPSIADRTFKMTLHAPGGHVTQFVAEVKDVNGKAQITRFSQQPGTAKPVGGSEVFVPGELPPMVYTLNDDGTLQTVEGKSQVITADGQSHLVDFAMSSEAGQEAENKVRWDDFNVTKDSIINFMASMCQKETNEVLTDPSKSQPQPTVILPNGEDATSVAP